MIGRLHCERWVAVCEGRGRRSGHVGRRHTATPLSAALAGTRYNIIPKKVTACCTVRIGCVPGIESDIAIGLQAPGSMRQTRALGRVCPHNSPSCMSHFTGQPTRVARLHHNKGMKTKNKKIKEARDVAVRRRHHARDIVAMQICGEPAGAAAAIEPDDVNGIDNTGLQASICNR